MNCRVCGGGLDVLASYENMPARAQHLPTEPDAGVTLVVCECRSCGLVQLANEPVPYWREVIRASGLSEEMMQFRRRQFDDFVYAHRLWGKRVAEIGSGGGEHLPLLTHLGADALGIEGLGDERMVENVDAFLMLSVLEHIPEPVKALRHTASMLKDGGVGIVEVPNFDMILREGLASEFMADHLCYFTADTLRRTLEMSGFEVLGVEPVWHDYILSATVTKRHKTDLSACKPDRLKRELDDFIGRHGDVAVWGAGHQALAVLAALKLGGRVRYVVDSAPFKQGKYTPATHIPIVSPEALKSDTPNAVIVACAAYSDEVVKIIRKDHAFPVAILRANGLEAA